MLQRLKSVLRFGKIKTNFGYERGIYWVLARLEKYISFTRLSLRIVLLEFKKKSPRKGEMEIPATAWRKKEKHGSQSCGGKHKEA